MWCLGLLFLLLGSCTADLFTAIADMQKMLGAEKEVTNIIENYIEAEQRRLDDLKRFADEYVIRNKYATDIGPDFVTNPINAYLLIKRLTSEWKKVEDIMRTNKAEKFIKNITDNRIQSQVSTLWIHTYIYVDIYIYMYIYVHIYVYTRTCICISTLCVYIFTYIYLCYVFI
uniref:P4Ha_N domain-containing protein n=1 Tax=Angiostrongylus cantonensis TaxID=6313 RepID=A0A0K0DQV6_ANGCA